jgi:hypothetical protein
MHLDFSAAIDSHASKSMNQFYAFSKPLFKWTDALLLKVNSALTRSGKLRSQVVLLRKTAERTASIARKSFGNFAIPASRHASEVLAVRKLFGYTDCMVTACGSSRPVPGGIQFAAPKVFAIGT